MPEHIWTLGGVGGRMLRQRGADVAGYQVAGGVADAYEANLVPAILAPFAQRLVDRVGLEAGDRVLDVACGTGAVARPVAPRGDAARIVGVDRNPAMLATARRVAADTQAKINNALHRTAEAEMQPYADDDGVVLPMEAHVVTARR